ncbi:hypothetical protein CCICO_09335 [Corynebacterium ciconiae DSM 44920]|uniref:DUF3017 domain-containing protein n=1 Tax=Corynebacterium ciconiae TaxID=227319 RepID=UPI000379CABA|nr:DUF3017 domain-containing protein [Corynebacterium ciconiae]WKD61875.1 hypothetical protein CCICO_09335 [Corynebacterium ciconiae DSM 44920]
MERVDPISDLSGNPHDRALPPSVLPIRLQQALMGLFCVGLVVATVFLFSDHWRRATFIFGASLVYLAAVRYVCDSRVLGVLAVRSRRFDVAFTAIIGGVMMYISASIDALGS